MTDDWLTPEERAAMEAERAKRARQREILKQIKQEMAEK